MDWRQTDSKQRSKLLENISQTKGQFPKTMNIFWTFAES